MCGCMLMHALMNHQEHNEHNPVAPSAFGSGAATIPATSGQRCAHCGFPLHQNYAFCPGCGLSLQMAPCPACGQKVDPGWRACAYCGSPLGEALEQPAS